MRSEFRYLVLAGIVCIMISFSVLGAVRITSGNCNTNTDEDVLFKFSGDNGHVATYNYKGEGYNEKVCVTKQTPSPGSNVYDCVSTSNTVLRIAGVKQGATILNAHVEDPSASEPNFEDKICYGKLNCRINEGTDCSSGETFIVSVSGRTNAHVAKKDFYTNNLCCGETGEVIPPETCGGTRKCCDSCKAGTAYPSGNSECDSRVCCEYCEIEVTQCDAKAEIEKPKEGEVFFVNAPVRFEQFAQGSTTECPNLKFKWNFGDGTSIGYCNGANGCIEDKNAWDATHQYASDGVKEVLLEVWDGSKSDSDRVRILIVNNNKKYIFAEITNPQEGASYPLYSVPYDATGSYAIDIDSSGNAKCLAGKCRVTAGGVSIINPSEASLDGIKFSWDYDSDNNINREGTGQGNARFDENAFFSRKPGQYTTKLIASLASESSIKDTDFASFFVAGCNAEGTTWHDINKNPFSTTNTALTNNPCMGFDTIAGNNNDCCPTGMTCSKYATTSYYVCQTSAFCSTRTTWYCSDYGNDEGACKNNICNAKHGCKEGQFGKCSWDGSKCVSACANNPPTPDWDPDSDLTTPWCKRINFDESPCDENINEKVISWEGEIMNGEGATQQVIDALDCKLEGSKTYPCGERMKLHFFSMINVIFGFMLLFGYYYAFDKKR